MRSLATPLDRAAGERARLGAAAAAALVLLAVVPFLNGLTAGFTFDDGAIVRDNPRLAGPERVGEIFTTHYFGGPLATAKNYRPVVLMTYAVQRWTTGTDPFPFHLVNVLLHAATTLFFAAWLLALGMPRAPSLAAAALFAVVPIHVEAVTGIVGRAELLVALLVFLSALLFLRATEGPRLRIAAYAVAVVAFLLALFTKEHAVVLPGVVVLGELLRLGADEPLIPRLRRKALAAAGLLAPLAVFVAFRAFFVGSGLVAKGSAFFELDNPLVTLGAPLRAANGLWLLLRYAGKTLVPLGLSADHSAHALPLASSLSEPMAIAGLLGVAALSGLALLSVRRLPLVALGLGLFLGAFLPTSNVPFPIGTIFAERLAYLPSAGLLAAVAGLASALPRASAGFRRALLAVALVTYAATTVERNEVFRSDETLYADLLVKVPRSARARYNAAYLAWGRGETTVARSNLEKAIALFPRHYDAWALLGLVEAKEGRHTEARAAARESLRIKPDYEIGWRTLAKVEEEAGRLDAADEALAAGLKRFPRSLPLLRRRGALLLARGRAAESAETWRTAIAVSGGAREDRLGLERALRAAPR
ncbi:MAG: tetratricopeptide repeat protein [Thermoanaerobaculia bacterium]